MNTDNNNQRPSMPDEPPVGSGPDRIAADTPTCERKNRPCPYWSDIGCTVQVCWVEVALPDRYSALLRQARDSLRWLVADCTKRNEFDGGPPEDSPELGQAREVLVALSKT